MDRSNIRADRGHWPRLLATTAAIGMMFSFGVSGVNAQPVDSVLPGQWVLIYGTPDGGDHAVGIADIARGTKAYTVSWQVENREARGVGFLRDGTLWLARGWGNDPGTCIYDLDSGRIDGVWSQLGSQGLMGSETWRGGNIDAEFARFQIHGTNPDGTQYEGKVTTRRHGDVYDVQWAVATMVFHGIGIRDGRSLVVAWCADGSVDVAQYRVGDDGLVGRSATLGSFATREERLVRPSSAPSRDRRKESGSR